MSWVCSNCNADGVANLLWSDVDFACICTLCGFIHQDLDYIRYTELFTKDTSGDTLDVPPKKRKYHRYLEKDRRAHLMERLSAAFMHEPEISSSDMELIRDGHNRFMDRNFFYKLRAQSGILDKRDIQNLLRFIDDPTGNKKRMKKKRGRKAFDKPYQEEAKTEQTEKRYTVLYLEKWKSIKTALLNITPSTLTEDDIIQLGTEFLKYSAMWNKLKIMGYFPERDHFPNFNFMFTKIAKNLKIDITSKEFPLPNTPSCIKQLENYYNILTFAIYGGQ